MEFSSVVWHTGYEGDLTMLEGVQRCWTKQISGYANVDYSSRLFAFDLYSIRGRLLRADLIKVWKIFNRFSPISPTDIFTLVPEARTQGHPLKTLHPCIHSDLRKRFFSVRIVGHWNSLPLDVVLTPTLSQFKRSLAHMYLGDRLYEFWSMCRTSKLLSSVCPQHTFHSNIQCVLCHHQKFYCLHGVLATWHVWSSHPSGAHPGKKSW